MWERKQEGLLYSIHDVSVVLVLTVYLVIYVVQPPGEITLSPHNNNVKYSQQSTLGHADARLHIVDA